MKAATIEEERGTKKLRAIIFKDYAITMLLVWKTCLVQSFSAPVLNSSLFFTFRTVAEEWKWIHLMWGRGYVFLLGKRKPHLTDSIVTTVTVIPIYVVTVEVCEMLSSSSSAYLPMSLFSFFFFTELQEAKLKLLQW